MTRIFKLLLLLSFTFSGYSQDLIDQEKNVNSYHIGMEFINPNISGNSDEYIDFMDMKPFKGYSLSHFDSKKSLGLSTGLQKYFSPYSRSSLLIDFGLYYIDTYIDYRRGNSKISEYNSIEEVRIKIDYKILYAYTSYRLNYKVSKKNDLNLVFGTKIAIQSYSAVKGASENYYIDYATSPRHVEQGNKKVKNKISEPIHTQIFINAGVYKGFNLRSNTFKLGLEYNHSLLFFHNAGRLNSSPFSLNIKYSIAKKRK